MQFLKPSVVGCILVIFSINAQASLVEIDFDTTPEGTSIAAWDAVSGQYSSIGVNFSAFEDGAAVSTELFPANFFGLSPFSSNSWYNTDSNFGFAADKLTITFDAAVENLQWKTAVQGGVSAGISFIAYDALGAIIEQTSTISSTSTVEYNGFSVSGIYKVDLLQPSDDWFWGLDDISFNFVDTGSGQVPLPATVLLMGLGLVGLRASRRKA